MTQQLSVASLIAQLSEEDIRTVKNLAAVCRKDDALAHIIEVTGMPEYNAILVYNYFA